MREANHYTAGAALKGSYPLPEEFDGTVNEAVLYHAVRALLNNRRQGTASTKTRGEVSGGNRKPWRQKGTGRARQGSIRSPIWRGGGIVFGPKPRSYRTDVPRKVRQAARQSALNARANEGSLGVIEALEFDAPKTKRLAELLAKLGLSEKKVLILTAETRPEVYRSGRNLPRVRVLRYADASALDILWSDALVVEEKAIGVRAVEGERAETTVGRVKRAKKASASPAESQPVQKAKKSASRSRKNASTGSPGKKPAGGKKGGGDA